jgi:hypothetical protein
MKFFVYLVILSCSFWSNAALAQRNINIYADVKNNDTLQKLVTIFTGELKKSSVGAVSVLPASAYQGQGIYISTAKESRQATPSVKLLKAGIEAFSVDADEKGVRILGNCNMAIGHGLFSYLESLGYRYYFANPDWHIIPEKPNLFRKWNIVSAPSFYHRRIWYGYGTGSKIADADYNFWILANKTGGSLNASFGHAYEGIALRNKELFSKHPEWYYPVAKPGEIPVDAKFDMTKEDLIQAIIRDVEKRIETSLKNKTNDYKMISLAPSDGLGTCNTPACQRLGTITDRVYYLINRVAKAIQKKYPSTLIGCMAYGEYAPVPTKKVEPNVFVAITTAFNSSKYTIVQQIAEWKKKGPVIGIYDYFSWYAWDYDVPGQSLASRSGEMTANIKKYYAKGVRAYEGESSIGWVSKGLGYYLAAKQMWDVNADLSAPKKEFFSLCFKKASASMQRLWNEWENYSHTTVRESDLARWIDYALEADKSEADENVRKRMFQVKSYLHYIYLYRNYQIAKNEPNLSALLNFGYRKLDDGSVSGFPSFYVLGNSSTIPGMAFNDQAKWKHNGRPVTADEINQWIRKDRNSLKIKPPVRQLLAAKKFTTVPGLARYQKAIADSLTNQNNYWFTNEWVIGIKNKGAANYIEFIGDYLANPTVTKPIKISIYPYTEDGNVSDKSAVFYYEYTATQVLEKISLANLVPGYYTMIIEDPIKIFRLAFSPAVNHSMVSRPWRQITSNAFFYAFIYVPEGTKSFNVIKTGNLGLITATGRKINFTDNTAEDVQVEVLKGEEGLWRVKPMYGKFYVEGIPPYMGMSAPQMLIPAAEK